MRELGAEDVAGLRDVQMWMMYDIWESVRADVRRGKMGPEEAAEVLRRLVQLLCESRG